jgi:hypothetical protein
MLKENFIGYVILVKTNGKQQRLVVIMVLTVHCVQKLKIDTDKIISKNRYGQNYKQNK